MFETIAPKPTTPPSIRKRIMQVFEARFASQKQGVGDAAITWNTVSRNPLSSDEQSSGYAIGIFDTSEQKKDEIQKINCSLNVVFEWFAMVAEGDNPADIVQDVLAEVQRVVTVDLNTKEDDGYQLTVDVQEKGNEIENYASDAKRVNGVVIFEVKYRHRPNKPWERC